MNSTELIQRAKDEFKALEDKGYEWKSFYNGFLIAYGVGIAEFKNCNKHFVTNRLEREAFEKQYLAKPSKESAEKYECAFQARLAYEKNCIAKYDYPDFMNKPSRPPEKGEKIGDYAMRYETTIKEMKDVLPAVERALANGL